MNLEPIHLHVFFAQFPVVLAGFGLAMFALGIVRRAKPMLETAFYALVATGVASIFAFFSGRYLAGTGSAVNPPATGHAHLAYLSVLLAMIISTVVLWLRYLPERKERTVVLIALAVLSVLFLFTEILGMQAIG